MKIWVDADACPAVVRTILFKASERTGIALVMVANKPVKVPPAEGISSILVPSGADAADREILRRLSAGDLVITADIPLAAQVIGKGGHALNPRGELYRADDIASRLSVRDFMDGLRADGVDTGGPPPMSGRDRMTFANNLDTFLARRLQELE